jgi:hypothetical protein
MNIEKLTKEVAEKTGLAVKIIVKEAYTVSFSDKFEK